MLTAQVLTLNNAGTIERCLESLVDFDIVVGDLGSTDGTAEIASRHARVVPVGWDFHFGDAKNKLSEMISSDWLLSVEPWEVLRSPEHVLGSLDGTGYKLYVQERDTLTKELRLWKKSSGRRFRRPAFETLEPGDGPLVPSFLCSLGGGRVVRECLRRWRLREPAAGEIDYYEACELLSEGRYREFLAASDRYLFRDPSSDSASATRYYQAQVRLRVFGDPSAAIRCLVPALASRPLMAEYWCLLGDCFLKSGQANRAARFYENAMTLGSFRRCDDDMPIEVAKYGDHPEKMLASLSPGR